MGLVGTLAYVRRPLPPRARGASGGQRTNWARNSAAQGAVVGTPGTLPTYWGKVGTFAGLTTQIVATGVEDAMDYIDVKCSGTSSATTGVLNFELGNIIVAAMGETWNASFYAKLVAGTTSGILTFRAAIYGRNSAGGATESGLATFTPTSTLALWQAAMTYNVAATVYAQPSFYFTLTNGAAIDFTIRLAAPQCEKNATATARIRTTGSAVTVTD